MTFEALLQPKRESILERWRVAVSKTYAPETARFLRSETDPFGNPVGQAIRECTSAVVDDLCGIRRDRESLLGALDGLVRIRAVQQFEPSQALCFVFQLKDVVRGCIRDELRGGANADRMIEVERRIDEIALAAFDAYAHCLGQMQEIRIKEIKNRSAVILKRMNLVLDDDAVPATAGETEGAMDG